MKASFPLAALVAATAAVSARADITLPSLISDHAVLQKSARTVLWGKAEAGEKITASLAAASGAATAGADGKWRLELDLSKVGDGPFDLTVEGKNKKVVHDVVVGEVWLASGQSNMEFALGRAIGGKEEIAGSTNPMLRQFHVANNPSPTPKDDCTGTWNVAGPKTSGDFTAVGYFFAKELQQTLHTPVGLVSTYIGGTPSEAWTSAEALDSDPALKAGRERLNKAVADYDGLKATYVTAFRDWEKKYGRADHPPGDPAAFAAPGIATADWKTVTLPGKFAAASLPDAGAVWLRKVVPLHGTAATGSYGLELTGLDGFETVYFNGRKVTANPPDNGVGMTAGKRSYPGSCVEGDNVIAIRLYNPLGNGGFNGDASKLTFGTIPLKGEWLAKAEYELPSLPDEAKPGFPTPPKQVVGPGSRPAHLYNGMIQPLIPYTLAGAIWYQGEANAARAFQYRTAFPLMINDWRHRWGYDFPFYYCQLASFMAKKPAPEESSWAEIREAQTRTLSLPKTGEAILIDIGESGDIHPRDKKDAGARLASIALAKTYGKSVPCSGPIYDAQKIDGDKVRLSFRELNGGLVARSVPAQYVVSSLADKTAPYVRNRPDSPLEGFAVCGEDKKWVWADARIDGDAVVVSNPTVPHPVAVRYDWADNPTGNLYNKAGFPAAPFRTDSFPGVTDKVEF